MKIKHFSAQDMSRRSLKSLVAPSFISLLKKHETEICETDLAQDPTFLLCSFILQEMWDVGGMDLKVIYVGGAIPFKFMVSKFPQKNES